MLITDIMKLYTVKWVILLEIQLMTDGGADIPSEISNDTNITIVPLYLRFGDQEYKTGETLDSTTFHKKIKELKQVPKSSAPSPNDFYEAFKKVEQDIPILLINISQTLSSTYENALLAKKQILDEEPSRNIAIIDAKSASCGIGLLFHETKKKIEEGYSFEELVAHLEDKVENMSTLFLLKSLDNLILGGRLDRVQGAIAKTLNIKLLLKAGEDGSVEVSEKIRGTKRSLKRFINQIEEYVTNVEEKTIVMTHTNAKEYGQSVLNKILDRYPFKEAYLTETGPLISTYAGEEGLVISFFNT